MPSPFPGMDPYVEGSGFWLDFHSRFLTYWCDTLADLLPDHYEASINERLVLEDLLEDNPKAMHPDVVITQGDPAPAGHPAPAGVAMLEPTAIPLLMLDRPRQGYLEILSRPGREVVTVLELLSPSNKTGSDRVAYLAKREALVHQEVHLVELDLLLGGRRLRMDGPLPPGDYYAFVSRAERRPDCDVYAWTLRQSLPRLPVPLKAPDPDLWFELGAVFATAYDRGRYARKLGYQEPPRVPLRDEDRPWALDCARTMKP
jgi:hypothetical protein